MKKPVKTREKHRNTPSQPRSRRMVEFIIEAATRVLRSQGIAGFTTNRIAEVAGVSIGSLYQYFRDKDAILEVIVARHLDEIRSVAQSGTGDTPSLALMDELIDGAVAAHARDPALHRAISNIPDDPARYHRISQAKQQLDADVKTALQQLLERLAPQADAARLHAATLILHSLVENAVHRAVAEEQGVYDIALLSVELKRAVRLYVENLAV